MTTLAEVIGLYERWGGEHYDEDVAQLDHALQTAAHASHAGASSALVAAALLHDVGHLLDLRGDPAGPHERTGPAFLHGLFSDAVTAPIGMHVTAKRYLCAVEPGYEVSLSTGSIASLRRQGGPLSPAEASRFEAIPGWADAVQLRRWDDAGKVEAATVPGLDHYEPLLRALSCSAS